MVQGEECALEIKTLSAYIEGVFLLKSSALTLLPSAIHGKF